MLKADFHIHTKEDFHDRNNINYSAKDLIRLAQKRRFDVLSITHHNRVFFNNEIKSYAKKKGILLIPGAEARLEGKHVILLNTSNDELRILQDLDSLEKLDSSCLIMAPHPYLKTGVGLGAELEKRIHQFDAIEYGHFFTRALLNPAFKFYNGNEKAERIAKKYKKALLGTSDAHKLYEFDRTYTLVDSNKSKDDVLDAILRRKVSVVANPLPVHLFFHRAGTAVGEVLKKKFLGIPDAPNTAEDPIVLMK